MTHDEIDAATVKAIKRSDPLAYRAIWNAACEACEKACEQKWEMGYRGDVVDGFARVCRNLKATP